VAPQRDELTVIHRWMEIPKELIVLISSDI
jgi:hypothetical protein